MLPKFYECEKKKQSREDTIIKPYRKLFNDMMPSDRQYWTLCNLQADEEGNIPRYSEIGQLIDSGLITMNQVHGVDLFQEVIDHNKKHLQSAHWYQGDIYDIMTRDLDNFNPGIINADFNSMGSKAMLVVNKIINLINTLKLDNVILLMNVMLNNPRLKNKKDIDELLNDMVIELSENEKFAYLFMEGNWSVYPNGKAYVYNGTGSDKTLMVTFVFYRKGGVNNE